MTKNTIGEEVIRWAEQYWHIDKVCKGELPEDAEQFSYDSFREIFINKIEGEIKSRLFPEDFVQDEGIINADFSEDELTKPE